MQNAFGVRRLAAAFKAVPRHRTPKALRAHLNIMRVTFGCVPQSAKIAGDVVQYVASMNGLAIRDLALRALVVVAGALAAVLLVLKGHAQALPALAVGATLGVFAMGRF